MAGKQSQVEEIVDADCERVLDRVCAIDVAKAFGDVCVRLPKGGQSSQRYRRMWQVTSTLNEVTALATQLLDLRIEKVTVESTSDYWRIWVFVLQAQGLYVPVGNAPDVKKGTR